MKKLLFILVFGFFQFAFAQNLAIIDLYVLDATGNPEPNFTLVVSDLGTASGSTLTLVTDINGRAVDSMAVGTQGQLYCDINVNGCLDTAQMFYNPSNGPIVYFSDTLNICNGTQTMCNYAVSTSKTCPNDPFYQGHYSFTSTFPVSPNSNYTWDFGDGNTSAGISPNHNYAQAGTYVYCLQIDSCPAVCDTVVVTNTNACGAYISSKPAYYDSTLTYSFNHTYLSNTLTTYSWDFGDGNSSALSKPTHTYAQPGTYYYCLTIDSCAPICDTLVVFDKKPVTVSGFIYDSAGLPMPQYPFNFNLRLFYNSTLSTSYLIGFWNVLHPNLVTDNNGFYTETIYTKLDPSMDSASVEVQIFDTCSLITTHGPQHFIPANANAITFVDTFSISCNAVIPNCNFAFGASVSQISNQTFGFWHQANGNNTFWDFGDGNTSTQANPIHTYTTPGTYVYCVTVDSCPPVCDTILIPSSTNCNASFIIDTVNSQPGNIVVWNTSTPSYTLNSTTQYLWDFGDGSTSTLPFPTHIYSGAGTYPLCLAINIPATATSQACSSLYCDTLKVDSFGNIIQKSSGAIIKLNVLDPNTISIEEDEITSLNIFPNPASDYINIKFDAHSNGKIKIDLIAINGALLNSTSRNVDYGLNTLELEVNNLAAGIYFVKLSKDGASYFEKLSIR